MMKKNDKSVAIKYDPLKDEAPIIVAKGEKYVAEKINQIAEDQKIPIYEDEDLVNKLIQYPLEQEIPVALYEVMAQILAFVYKLDSEK